MVLFLKAQSIEGSSQAEDYNIGLEELGGGRSIRSSYINTHYQRGHFLLDRLDFSSLVTKL